MSDKIFGVLQRVGRAFMLPISILPIAGLFLGIGNSLTAVTTLKAYGLMDILGPGTIPYYILIVMKNAGLVVFDNLPILFAIGVAIGMSKSEKEIGALASVLAYLVMNSTIDACMLFAGMITETGRASHLLASGMATNVLGITTLEMGAFGGIIVGVGVAYLNNRFHMQQLPTAFSFFEGSRFVLIISTVVYLFVGGILFFTWPWVQAGISQIGILVTNSGYLGTLAYGMIKRSLIPFGLHHIFYLPFWQTAVGGTAEVAGRYISGAQNIFFAQLADHDTVRYSVEACRFFSGEFVFMIFGLPGAALAMWQTAKPEHKKKVGGLLLSATLASVLTGITEPLEFAFLFVAPILYIVHLFLAGLAYMLTHVLGIAVGLTFSGGFLDFLLFGIMQGNEKTHWMRLIPLGLVYFALYYGIFRTLILKLDLKTPGREEQLDDKEEVAFGNPKLKSLIPGLGGMDNIIYVDSCATRLRVTVEDADRIDQEMIKKSGSAGMMIKGNNLQIIYGPKVGMLRKQLDHMLDHKEDNLQEEIESFDKNSIAEASHKKTEEVQLKEVPIRSEAIHAFANGQVIAISDVDDIVFSSGLLGDGFAILPTGDNIFAPVDGTVASIYATEHAISIRSDKGADLLIHIGIDTSRIKEKIFAMHVQPGQHVKQGDPICTFNKRVILEQGYSLTSPLIINNTDSYESITSPASKNVEVGDVVIQTNI